MSNARGEVQKHTCDCGHTHIVSERQISLSTSSLQALWSIFKWCKAKGVHEFETKDVKHLLDHTQYATLGDWVYFGGLVYKEKKAHYGLNMPRCEEFFRNSYAIPISVWKNPVTKAVRPEEKLLARNIPSLAEFLDQDGEYMVQYRAAQPSLI